jgi:putative tricarboxylic transport membrane protein
MSTKKNEFNALTSIVVIIFGLLYSIMSYTLPRATIGNANDPIYFPLGLGILLVIVGVLLFLKSDRSKLIESLHLTRAKSDKDKEVSFMVIMTCIIAVVYGLTFEHLGFVLSTFIFMMGVLWVTNKGKWLVNTIVASVFSVSIFMLFNYALGIPLPGLPF